MVIVRIISFRLFMYFPLDFCLIFISFLPVEITDVLGHVLYSGNLTLNQPSRTVDIYISDPSYAVQFVNSENVPASSPLAIQSSSINQIGNTTVWLIVSGRNTPVPFVARNWYDALDISPEDNIPSHD